MGKTATVAAREQKKLNEDNKKSIQDQQRDAQVVENEAKQLEQEPEKPGVLKRMWNAVKDFFSRLFGRKKNSEQVEQARLNLEIRADIFTDPTLDLDEHQEPETLPEPTQLETDVTEAVNQEPEKLEPPKDENDFDFHATDDGEIGTKGTITLFGNKYNWTSESGVAISVINNNKVYAGTFTIADNNIHFNNIGINYDADGKMKLSMKEALASDIKYDDFKLGFTFEQEEYEKAQGFKAKELSISAEAVPGGTEFAFEGSTITFGNDLRNPDELTGTNAELTELPKNLSIIDPVVSDTKKEFALRKDETAGLQAGYDLKNYFLGIGFKNKVEIVTTKGQDGFFPLMKDGGIGLHLEKPDEDIYALRLLGKKDINVSDQLRNMDLSLGTDGLKSFALKLENEEISGFKISGDLKIDGAFKIENAEITKEDLGLEVKDVTLTIDDTGFKLDSFSFAIDVKLPSEDQSDGDDSNEEKGGDDQDKGDGDEESVGKLTLNASGIVIGTEGFKIEKITSTLSELDLKNGLKIINITVNGSYDNNMLNVTADGKLGFSTQEDRLITFDEGEVSAKLSFSKMFGKSEEKQSLSSIGTFALSTQGAIKGHVNIEKQEVAGFTVGEFAVTNKGFYMKHLDANVDLQEEVSDQFQMKGAFEANEIVISSKGFDVDDAHIKLEGIKWQKKDILNSLEMKYVKESNKFTASADLSFPQDGYSIEIGSKTITVKSATINYDSKATKHLWLTNFSAGLSMGRFEVFFTEGNFAPEEDNTFSEVGVTMKDFSGGFAALFGKEVSLTGSLTEVTVKKDGTVSYNGFKVGIGDSDLSIFGFASLKGFEVSVTQNEKTGEISEIATEASLELTKTGSVIQSLSGTLGFVMNDSTNFEMRLVKAENIETQLTDYGKGEIGSIDINTKDKRMLFQNLRLTASAKDTGGKDFVSKILKYIDAGIVLTLDELEYVNNTLNFDSSKLHIEEASATVKIGEHMTLDILINDQIKSFTLTFSNATAGDDDEKEAKEGEGGKEGGEEEKEAAPYKMKEILGFKIPVWIVPPAVQAEFGGSFEAGGCYEGSIKFAIGNKQREGTGGDSGTDPIIDKDISLEGKLKLEGGLGLSAYAGVGLGGLGVSANFRVRAGAYATAAAALHALLTAKYLPDAQDLASSFEIQKEKTQFDYQLNAALSAKLSLEAGVTLPSIFNIETGELSHSWTLKEWALGSVDAQGLLAYNKEKQKFLFSSEATTCTYKSMDEFGLFEAKLEKIDTQLAAADKKNQQVLDLIDKYSNAHGINELQEVIGLRQRVYLMTKLSGNMKDTQEQFQVLLADLETLKTLVGKDVTENGAVSFVQQDTEKLSGEMKKIVEELGLIGKNAKGELSVVDSRKEFNKKLKEKETVNKLLKYDLRSILAVIAYYNDTDTDKVFSSGNNKFWNEFYPRIIKMVNKKEDTTGKNKNPEFENTALGNRVDQYKQKYGENSSKNFFTNIKKDFGKYSKGLNGNVANAEEVAKLSDKMEELMYSAETLDHELKTLKQECDSADEKEKPVKEKAFKKKQKEKMKNKKVIAETQEKIRKTQQLVMPANKKDQDVLNENKTKIRDLEEQLLLGNSEEMFGTAEIEGIRQQIEENAASWQGEEKANLLREMIAKSKPRETNNKKVVAERMKNLAQGKIDDNMTTLMNGKNTAHLEIYNKYYNSAVTMMEHYTKASNISDALLLTRFGQIQFSKDSAYANAIMQQNSVLRDGYDVIQTIEKDKGQTMKKTSDALKQEMAKLKP